jgi:carbamoyl-phosphate synthase small subunit
MYKVLYKYTEISIMQQTFPKRATSCCKGWCVVHDATLILSDGTWFTGIGFGRRAPLPADLVHMEHDESPLGEVLFNTTMGAYHEILTDPSYAGQTIVMTSAHMGNYGCDPSWDETFLHRFTCKSLILRDLYDGPLPPGRASLGHLCAQWNVCGLTDVDTRALTLHLRSSGSQYGVVVDGIGHDTQAIRMVTGWIRSCPAMGERDFITPMTVPEPIRFESYGDQHASYALWDFGTKASIVEQLRRIGIGVTVFPASIPLVSILSSDARYDALFLSNGPGDPASLQSHVKQIASVIGTIPVVGICLGHQLAAQALGAKTMKMLYGHHGPNHPVRDLISGNVYVTAQNHGYCVDPSTFPPSAMVWLVNDNDQTVEGFFDEEHRVMTVQFHPEAGPGPWEARSLFGAFRRFVETGVYKILAREAEHAC